MHGIPTMHTELSSRITFSEYMTQALYGPEGYYSTGRARSGRAGDYFTAADTGPLFGQLLAAIFARWQEAFKISPFHLVEMGAGEGALAASIGPVLSGFPYMAVERSPARRRKLEAVGKAWPGSFQVLEDLSALEKHPVAGCFFANELVDAFPVHRVRQHNGKLEEAYVDTTRDSRLAWGPPSTPRLQAYFERVGVELPEGYETEVNLAMSDWVHSVARSLQKGLVLLIDYGRAAADYYATERAGGTLRSFSRHRVQAFDFNPVFDLTADVDFTSLALDARAAGLEPLAFMELGSFLLQAAKELLEGGRVKGEKRNTGPGFAPHPSPIALQYLVHPEGMGSAFQVLILGKDVSTFSIENNRLYRLGLPS